MNIIDRMDRVQQRPSVILNEARLALDYLPSNLPFREKHLTMLSHYFNGLLTSSFSTNKVIIVGSNGVGKTSIAKKLGEWLNHRATLTNAENFQYVHINCRRAKTPYMVLLNILKEISGKVLSRGYATSELLNMVINILEEKCTILLLVLDEIEYVITRGGNEFLYSLTRTTDDKQKSNHHIGLILIGRNSKFRIFLDKNTTRSLSGPVIEVEPYKSEEIKQILYDRISDCFVPGSVSDESLKLIAAIAEKCAGNARHAIELLQIAGKCADFEQSSIVYPDHVRKAKANIDPPSFQDVIINLPPHLLFLLLGISRSLKQTKLAYIPTSLVEKGYYLVAEEYNTLPHKKTRIWKYMKELNIHGIISIKKSENSRGKPKNISILDINLDKLETEVTALLKVTKLT